MTKRVTGLTAKLIKSTTTTNTYRIGKDGRGIDLDIAKDSEADRVMIDSIASGDTLTVSGYGEMMDAFYDKTQATYLHR